jgi:hypothetical protein
MCARTICLARDGWSISNGCRIRLFPLTPTTPGIWSAGWRARSPPAIASRLQKPARTAAGVLDAARESIVEASERPRERVSEGLVGEGLVGKWTHPLVTLTIAADGTAIVTTILGSTKKGHWSVDGQGRLLTDATGAMEPTDAALEAGRLTIQLEGQRLTFTRAGDV